MGCSGWAGDLDRPDSRSRRCQCFEKLDYASVSRHVAADSGHIVCPGNPFHAQRYRGTAGAASGPASPVHGQVQDSAATNRTAAAVGQDRMTEAHKEFILMLEDVNKTFDGFKAISNLNFYMDAGELRVIIGPNGAGKSSMLDLITGRTRPDTGRIEYGKDTDLTRLNEYQINRLGIGRKFQTPSVYIEHTVFENVLLSLPGTRSVWEALFSRTTPRQRERIDEVLEMVGLRDKASVRAGLLAHGQKQWLEIGMLLAQDPKLLLVDEPAAGMTDEETSRTGELLLSLAGKHSIIVIEHDMAFVRQIATKVTVLHQGTVLCEGTVDEVQNNERVIEVYLGRKKKDHH